MLLLQHLLNGLLAGAYYLLIALGLSLIFSLGGLVNLAHGAFYALGAYFAVKLADTLGFGGVLVASPVLVALIGLVVERFLFRRFYREDPALGLLLTFGIAMVAECLASCGLRRSKFACLGISSCRKARATLMTLATPEAASVWPKLDFCELISNGARRFFP